MKTLNKIKSIYLLAIVAILSFCMLLFPTMGRTANAEEVKMGNGVINVSSVGVKAYSFTDESTGETHDKWAIMFKAQITEAQYNKITVDGAVDVKLGMLIGRTSRLYDSEGNFIYTNTTRMPQMIKSKADGGFSFVPISYAGSESLGGQEVFFNADGVFEFEAGIIYDIKATDFVNATPEQIVSVATKDLTVIPFYMNVAEATVDMTIDTYKILWDYRKNVTPRDVLIEYFANEEVKEVNSSGSYTNALQDSTLNTFVGTVPTVDTNDNYICRSTNRIMTGAAGGELTASDFVTDGATVSVVCAYKPFGEVTGVAGSADTLDVDLVGSLPKGGQVNVVIHSADGIKVYANTKVAERVIKKFTDAGDGVADYLTTSGENGYTSIFAVANNEANFYTKAADTSPTATTGSLVTYLSMNNGYSGLYVLGNSIDFSDDKEYLVYTGVTFSSKISATAGQNSKSAFCAPIYGRGFNGTFDGRGFYIETYEKANQGIFPSSFDATIKNTAFLSLTQTSEGGGITAHARASRFENIYAEVDSATNGHADLNKGVLMNVQDCDFKNFVAKVDIANGAVDEMNKSINASLAAKAGADGYGYGQGVELGGVFSFRAYPDMFYDNIEDSDSCNGIRRMTANADLNNAFATRIQKVLSAAEIERLFPNSIVIIDGQETISPYGFDYVADNVVNPAPYAKTGHDATGSGGVRKYANELHTVFVGTKGENVYTVGSSPLYIARQFNEVTGSSNTVSVNITSSNVNTNFNNTTIFVNSNSAPELVAKGADSEVLYAQMNTTYLMNEIAGDMFAFDADSTLGDTYSLGEIIFCGRIRTHAGSRAKYLVGAGSVSNTNISVSKILAASKPAEKLKVQFVSQEGFYDCADETQMKAIVLDNQATKPFDANFWTVETDGTVTWNKLPTQA